MRSEGASLYKKFFIEKILPNLVKGVLIERTLVFGSDCEEVNSGLNFFAQCNNFLRSEIKPEHSYLNLALLFKKSEVEARSLGIVIIL